MNGFYELKLISKKIKLSQNQMWGVLDAQLVLTVNQGVEQELILVEPLMMLRKRMKIMTMMKRILSVKSIPC